MSVHLASPRETQPPTPTDTASSALTHMPPIIDTHIVDISPPHQNTLPPAPKPPSEAVRIAKRLTKRAIVGAGYALGIAAAGKLFAGLAIHPLGFLLLAGIGAGLGAGSGGIHEIYKRLFPPPPPAPPPNSKNVEKAIPKDKTTASEIAGFLLENKDLRSSDIADYLGSEENTEILNEYVKQKYNFTQKSFETALREFLTTTFITLEGQKKDRILKAFATHYYDQNINVVKNSDAAFSLADTILFLHTMIYHPQVKQKTSESQFINMLKGFNDGEDFPVDMLKAIYADITKREIKRAQ